MVDETSIVLKKLALKVSFNLRQISFDEDSRSNFIAHLIVRDMSVRSVQFSIIRDVENNERQTKFR